ncbi:hypothetical protein ACHAXT_009699 [Thalassiosira profunda]
MSDRDDGSSDGGSDGEEERNELLDQLDYLEVVVRDLKQTIISAGENEALVASALQQGNEQIRGSLAWLRMSADKMADRMGNELYALVAGNPDEPLDDDVWKQFHQKLQFFNEEGVSDEFRQMCLCRWKQSDDGRSLIHKLCQRNPPAEAVRALLEIIPENAGEIRWDGFSYQFNHLALTAGSREYPLQMVLRYGGSLGLVKLLVEADEEKVTLESHSFQVLITRKAKHRPEVFSEVLRFLILSTRASPSPSPLLIKEKRSRKTPVARLWHVLDSSGLSARDILSDADFVFLLKATCYHHSANGGSTIDADQLSFIDSIPLHRAFLVCAPCFEMDVVRGGLEYLFSIDDAVLEPDANGDYILHEIFWSESFFISIWEDTKNTYSFDVKDEYRIEMVEMMVEIAPKCARLIGSDGRSMLHIAADSAEPTQRVSDSRRLNLVRAVWEAYPDAANIVDKKTALPPFALAAREEEREDMNGRKRRRDIWSEGECSISSSFFLLREAPDILSEYI